MLRRLISTTVFASVLLSAALVPTVGRSQPVTVSPSDSSVKTHAVLGISFDAPTDFSEVQDLARDTAGIIYPKNETQSPKMVVRFAELQSSVDGGWVQFSASEQMTFAKYLFTGNNSPAQDFSQREFFGQTLTGEVQTVRTPNGYRYIELYVVPLEKSQRRIAIAFESDTMLSLAKVETAIDTVTQSLYELDKAELKALRKEQKKKQKEQKAIQKELERQ